MKVTRQFVTDTTGIDDAKVRILSLAEHCSLVETSGIALAMKPQVNNPNRLRIICQVWPDKFDSGARRKPVKKESVCFAELFHTSLVYFIQSNRKAKMLKILLVTAATFTIASGCGEGEPAAREAAQETTETATTAETAPEVTEVNNTVCPVMGNAVAMGQSFDWEGYRIGICCPGCEASFKAAPQNYIPMLLEDPGVSEEVKAELSSYLETAETTP